MKHLLIIILIIASFFAVYPPQSAQANTATITLLNPPVNMEVHLAVGETFTPEVYVESDVTFNHAVAAPDFQYPGRYVTAKGHDRIAKATSGNLALTFTAKGSTADLPDGYAPVTLVIGVRYKGGEVVAEFFTFAVYVE